MRTVSIELPVRQDDDLSQRARRRNSTRSALLREALEALAKGRRHSVTAATDEILEPFEGRADLSMNPKHLGGYGK
jgi:predicted transcriptional regulator